MIASLLLLAESLFRDRLEAWARTIHVASLIVLGWAWLAPPLSAGFTRWRARRRAPRVSYWACGCGNVSPLEVLSCGKCAATRRMDWTEKWDASPAGKKWSALLARVGGVFRGAGWAVYYLVPAWVFLLLQADRFGGGALRELFAGTGLLLAVSAVVLVGRAVSRGAGFLTRGVLLLAAGSVAGLSLLSVVLWAAAPYPPSHPIASVRLLPNGRVHYTTSDGRVFDRSGALQENAVEFQVNSAFISWPIMHVRQTVPLSIGNESIAEPWVERFLRDGARRRRADGPHQLRIALRGDTLFAPPGGPYLMREAQDGAGLVLVNPEEQR